MSFSKYKTWNFGEVLTSADLNASFDAIENQEQDIGTPRTQAFDMDGQELILDADADTSITADTDDRIDFRIQGQDLFKMNGTAATSVNGLTWVASATGNPAQIQAHGSDTNIGITTVPKGSGNYTVTATTGNVVMTAVNITLDASGFVDVDGAQVILDADADSSIRETSDDVITMKLQGVDSFIWDGDAASPVNGLTFSTAATTVDPAMAAHGSDSVINVRLTPKSTGVAACAGGWAVDGTTNLTWRWQGSGTSLLLQENTGTPTAPTWTTRNTLATGVGISGGLVFLANYAPSSAASVDITSVISATYDRYIIKFQLIPATDSVQLAVRTDTSNGASFDSGASDYSYAHTFTTPPATLQAGASDGATSMLFSAADIGNATNEGVSGEISIDFLGSASMFPILSGRGGMLSASTVFRALTFSGSRRSAAAINAVQLLFSSGNIASGNVKVYGVVNA